MKTRTIVISGANGFIGRYLSRFYRDNGWRVVAIARSEKGLAQGVDYHPWDGMTLGDWAKELDGAELLVNLAGRSVNCRYGEKNKRIIRESRVQSTQVLGEAIRRCCNPPALWVNSSTATIYRHAEDRAQGDFDGELGTGFSVEVAKAWEESFFGAEVPGTVRKVAMRTAIVFAEEKGTVWDVLVKLSKKWLGGTMGNGRQKVSWIHIGDFCRVVEWLRLHEEASGVYNVSAPNPIDNRELMKQARKAAGRCFGLPATKWMLEIGAFFLRTETELILKSRWVVPTRLLEEGFEFRSEEFGEMFNKRRKD